jgi:LPS sulfotransferase NodH
MNLPPDNWRLFMVIGTQRTGTNLLRDILNSHADIIMVAEVMLRYPDTCHWEHFAATQPPESLWPADEAAGLALLDRYFAYFHDQVRAKWHRASRTPKPAAPVIGVDIKCDQLRLIQPTGWPPTATPFMLHYARRRGVILINTIRRNTIQCAISYQIGLRRDFWHNYENRKVECAYELDIAECLANARAIVQQQREFEHFMQDYPVATCHYEDLAATVATAGPRGDLSSLPGPLRGIADAFGLDCRFSYDGRLQRAINRPYNEIISNHAAMVAAVRESEFSSLAGTIS